MPRTVAVLGYDGAELLDIACVTSTLAMANGLGALRDPYDVVLVSSGRRPITCGPGIELASGDSLEHVTGPLDTLIVSGGLGHAQAAADPLVTAHVRRLAQVSRRVASVCTGASILAAAGLLSGRRVTTHWRFARRLAAQYPAVAVDPDPIYIRDGNVSTAAGVTSALDLTLSFVQEDHGAELARLVSRHLITYLQRPGSQAQMSMFTAGPPAEHDIVRRVIDHIESHLGEDIGTAALATLVGLSPRHLSRLFLADLGVTPGRFVRQARTEAAAHLIATTSLPLPGIATRCGFGSVETLRLAFSQRYGTSPSRFRALQGSK
ncbi:MAG TPA: DJ-1/PfpI family protein [Kineosporiaceae bacterium]|nr:DJ-1/PfpI family protein [Kineosporiaceae bacterium]